MRWSAMNYIDWAILTIIGISALIGMYHGFVLSALHVMGFFVSWIGAWIFHPKLADYIDKHYHLLNAIIYYAEGASKISDAFLQKAAPSSVEPSTINDILVKSGIPSFMRDLLSNNATVQTFNRLGVQDLGGYFDTMFGRVILNVISFIIILLALRIIIGIIISIVRHITDLPVLKQLDSLAGLGFGALRGFLLIMVIFALVDAIMVIMPLDFVSQAINSSTLGRFFYENNLITEAIRLKF